MGVIDEAALLDALEAGHLRGAGLDVLEDEPCGPENPVFKSTRVVVSPHIAGGTELARRQSAIAAAQAAIDVVIHGQVPAFLINTTVVNRSRVNIHELSQ
ncbi:NAD(P)-dependent oxidoreductase [Blastococcus brunescens]|uniref:NAD(P)-dependent oxidoreductase n=1 Tax=Blastococcus brunescens TaxID=1564165 RepID=A0ABZ1B7R7_9ACTN|nr:NAD(P)-dependent oxidoreductase [Blastococcus sp. BMG 8361]WRL65434.1 NAD(P)-dependent oxidoreductase [Blastococcus sp. BMG 8361]